MIATSKQHKRIDKTIVALTDIANEANFLWNDNIDPENNAKLRDLSWSAVTALRLAKEELDKQEKQHTKAWLEKWGIVNED